MTKLDSIWNGVYRNFAESGGDETVFEGDLWLNNATEKAKIKKPKSKSDNENSVPPLAITHDYILPVIATLTQVYTNHLKIVDFGGGLANSFLETIACMQDTEGLEFHIVESTRSCQKWKESFPDDSRLMFHTSLPELDNVNIVHIGSALQYIEDWKGLIERLAEYAPDSFVLAHLHAGDIPESFVTLQHYYGREIPCWFWKLTDIIHQMNDVGYKLCFKARHMAKVLGKVGPLPMAALPDECQLEDFCQLVFVKKT